MAKSLLAYTFVSSYSSLLPFIYVLRPCYPTDDLLLNLYFVTTNTIKYFPFIFFLIYTLFINGLYHFQFGDGNHIVFCEGFLGEQCSFMRLFVNFINCLLYINQPIIFLFYYESKLYLKLSF